MNATEKVELRVMRGSCLKLSVYADDDYAAASNDRSSLSGVAVIMGGRYSYRQEEFNAEYVASCDA